MKNMILIYLVFSVGLLFGQRDFSKVVITETKIGEDFYMLEGSGGNIMICIGKENVLMIDSQFAPLSEKIKSKISDLSGGKPIQYLINTHYHGDHTGGNENFSDASILAHANVKERLSKDQVYKAFNKTVKAKPETFWPNEVYHDKMNLDFEGHQVVLIHVPNAHTDGDSGIFFPDDNVIHLGDNFFKDRWPYIDLAGGGTVNGLISAIKQWLLIVDDETKIIPGHGKLANKKELEKYLIAIETMKARVEAELEIGTPIEEMKAVGLDEGFESWGTGFISGEKFIDTIWTDLTRGEQ